MKTKSILLGERTLLLLTLLSAVTVLGQPTPPSITTQPADRAERLGGNVTLSVSVSGTAPLTYQWRQGIVDLPDATNRSLALRNLQLTNAGDYTVVVTNAAGAITSRVALVSVGLGRVYTNAQGSRLPYRLFLPRNYAAAEKYPLVLFWHGAGEAGTDNRAQLADQGQFVFLSAANQIPNPCFFLAPQLPFVVGCESDFAFEDQTVELLELLQTEFSIDRDRLYVTGLSMGGYVSWNFIARYPDLFAAAVPMSGGWGCSIFDLYLGIRIPVWNFHAANDSVVPASGSDMAISSLRGAGGNPIYTRYASGGHGIWPKAYGTPVLAKWLMAQRRGQSSTNPPLVTITSPTSEPNCVATTAALELAGTATLGQSNVLQVTGTNALNGFGRVATGTNDWSVTAGSLELGVTNIIVVTARGTSYVPSYGGNTTFNDTLAVLRIINTAPGFTKGPDQIVVADGGPQSIEYWATNISAGSPLESGQRLTFVVSNDSPGLFDAPPAISPTGTLTYEPAPGGTGTATIMVWLKDDGGTEAGGQDTSAPRTFRITVLPPNHPPVARISIAPLAEFPGVTNRLIISPNGLNAVVVLDASGSSDPDQDPLQFEWWADARLLGTGVVCGHLFPVGVYPVSLVVSDGTASATASITFEIITPSKAVGIVEEMVLESGLARNRQHPLLVTLDAAVAAFDRRNNIAGLNELHAFENKLRAQLEAADPTLADALMRSAQVITQALLR